MFEPRNFSRRHALQNLACGFGYMALAGLATGRAHAARVNPLASHAPHFAPKAKRVIFLFMQGGVSHVDSFDHKPLLDERDGKMMDFDDARKIANSGKREASSHRVMKSLWKFSRRGQCGHWGSELFPHMANKADELCFLHSLHTEGVAHGPATLFLHCGSTNFIRPSMGSWVSYGLGSESENLPAFVSLSPSSGNGGPRNYGNAFLPSVHQGTAIGKAGSPIGEATIRNLTNPRLSPAEQRRSFEFMQEINAEQLKRHPGDSELEAVISSYELAWRMQNHAPDILNLTKESPATLALYGIGEKPTDNFGRQCLMARRLCESGVRFIQVTYGDNSALAVDKPVAGLLEDLKQRGLLEDTIVWWGGEFGRTPYAEKNGTGRDHNPGGFTAWLAGGGVKPGFSFGTTDEWGHLAVENKIHMHDLHATILHLLGLDHEKLTYRFDGRDFRLTDVHGHIVRDIIA